MTQSISPVHVERDQYGFWIHPHLPRWTEDTPRATVEQWFADQNLVPEIKLMEYDAPEEVVLHYFDAGEPDCLQWHPQSDNPAGFLLSIHDSEDGPVAVFGIPKHAEIEQ